MDKVLAGFLDGLCREGRQHDAPLEDRLLRLRNMTPEAAGLVAAVIRVQGSRRVLEIGTSNGYSAVWFGDAVRDTGGRLVTVEVDAERVAVARGNLEAAGVSEFVTVVHGDGGEVLRSQGDGEVDLVVLDAERPAYAGYWGEVRRVLSDRGVVAVDNAVSHGAQVAELRELMEGDEEFFVRLVEVGDGVLMGVRTR